MTLNRHQITDGEYAAALSASWADAEKEIRAQTVRYLPEQDVIEIVTTRGAGFLVPRQWVGALENVPKDELKGLATWPDGSAIELESRDIQISVDGLITAILPAMLPSRTVAAMFASRGGRATTEAKRTSARANGRRGGRRSLHVEIADILRESGSMPTREIARAVNKRDRYHKRDGTKVDSGQVAARISKYPQLFERRGQQVRLKRR